MEQKLMNDEVNAVIEVRLGQVWLGEDGILRAISTLPNAEMKLEDAKEAVEAYRQAGQGKPRPLFSDSRKIKTLDRESRVYSASKEVARVITAAAIMIDSPVGRVIGNFFLRVNKPRYPCRLFTSEDEALKWLKTFIE